MRKELLRFIATNCDPKFANLDDRRCRFYAVAPQEEPLLENIRKKKLKECRIECVEYNGNYHYHITVYGAWVVGLQADILKLSVKE